MERTYTVAVLIGSLRKASYNRMTAKQLIALAPPNLAFEVIEIGTLPFFNQDLEFDPSAGVTEFKDKITAADAVLFVTPEYNRSVPGVLKNAIDVASRPYGQNAFDGKPAAIVSVSIGAISGFGANHHLRQSLTFLNLATMAQPEAYIGGAAKLFNEEGELVNEGTAEFLRTFMASFAAWIKKQLA